MVDHVEPEVQAERQRLQWQMLFVIGVGLALFGSYLAVTAMFDNDTVCFGAGFDCITVDDSEQIWLGLVAAVIGVAALLKGRAELRR